MPSACALALGASLLWAAGTPSGGGRLPRPAADPASAPVIDAIEALWPEVERTARTDVQVPAKNMSLGLSTKLYQCWQLRLNGTHGLQVYGTLERLKSLREALNAERERLLHDLGAYAAAKKPDAALLRRIEARGKTLSSILAAHRQLVESGLRNELIRTSAPGALDERGTIRALLHDDDYVMQYDDSRPECPRQAAPR